MYVISGIRSALTSSLHFKNGVETLPYLERYRAYLEETPAAAASGSASGVAVPTGTFGKTPLMKFRASRYSAARIFRRPDQFPGRTPRSKPYVPPKWRFTSFVGGGGVGRMAVFRLTRRSASVPTNSAMAVPPSATSGAA